MTDPLTQFAPRQGTAQTEQADPRQVPNSAAGFTFTVTPGQRLLRFLTLGSEAPTYYATARELTKGNATFLIELAKRDHPLMIQTILRVSQEGRAPRQNPTLFAYAVACSYGTDYERATALNHLRYICRTGTHLFQFATYVEQFRGWGRGLRRAVGDWYLTKDRDKLAYQLVKYRQRGGWTHRDLLRLAHPSTDDIELNDLFAWVTGKPRSPHPLPGVAEAYLRAQEPGADISTLIRQYRLPWEALPDEALTRRETWEAILSAGMPVGAMLRQLPRLTRLGVLDSREWREEITDTLTNATVLKGARIHPVNVLVAQRTYAQGRGDRGSSTWTPVPQVTDALDAAFYASFGAVEPAGKRTMLALDVSGSMGWGRCGNTPLTPREASAALALVQTATEPECVSYGFTGNLTRLDITPRRRLDDVIRAVSGLRFGRTDCAAPMVGAMQANLEIDTFLIYTDNETWAGQIHPHEALRQYRDKTGIDAKLIVAGMTATNFTIADPSDPGMLDCVGFDSALPNVISDFSREAL